MTRCQPLRQPQWHGRVRHARGTEVSMLLQGRVWKKCDSASEMLCPSIGCKQVETNSASAVAQLSAGPMSSVTRWCTPCSVNSGRWRRASQKRRSLSAPRCSAGISLKNWRMYLPLLLTSVVTRAPPCQELPSIEPSLSRVKNTQSLPSSGVTEMPRPSSAAAMSSRTSGFRSESLRFEECCVPSRKSSAPASRAGPARAHGNTVAPSPGGGTVVR
mmetsp:Transcript_24517/g.79198  ORF Transcript_24517/g.79198 Transcript_24517/m.79198 type:complete len:216 (+) Transcript_24517:638-1285(+)